MKSSWVELRIEWPTIFVLNKNDLLLCFIHQRDDDDEELATSSHCVFERISDHFYVRKEFIFALNFIFHQIFDENFPKEKAFLPKKNSISARQRSLASLVQIFNSNLSSCESLKRRKKTERNSSGFSLEIKSIFECRHSSMPTEKIALVLRAYSQYRFQVYQDTVVLEVLFRIEKIKSWRNVLEEHFFSFLRISAEFFVSPRTKN